MTFQLPDFDHVLDDRFGIVLSQSQDSYHYEVFDIETGDFLADGDASTDTDARKGAYAVIDKIKKERK